MSKYEIIYKKILSEIENGIYKPGNMLPGEFELMEIYSASRDTIRKSLSLLSQNGYIQKSKGRGSIVLDINRYEFPVDGVISFKELMKNTKNVKTEVISIDKIIPDLEIQKQLNLLKDDMVWKVQRIRKIDNESVILDIDYFNSVIVPELTKEIAEESIYEYLEEYLGLKIAYASKEITCQSATDMDKKYIELKGYDMIVNIESHTYLEDTKLFQFTSSRHRPDKFRFKDFARRIHIE